MKLSLLAATAICAAGVFAAPAADSSPADAFDILKRTDDCNDYKKDYYDCKKYEKEYKKDYYNCKKDADKYCKDYYKCASRRDTSHPFETLANNTQPSQARSIKINTTRITRSARKSMGTRNATTRRRSMKRRRTSATTTRFVSMRIVAPSCVKDN